MKVLVIDDNPVHRRAAEQTLSDHDLTVVNAYDEAVKLLEVRYDKEAIERKLIAAGLPTSLQNVYSSEEQRSWWKSRDQFQAESQIPYWDAVLVDLLMPAGRDAQGPEGRRFIGSEMPVGFALALLAALNGAKYVAVVTATNHHNHPASALLDRLNDTYWRDETTLPNFVINGAKAMFVHHPSILVDGTTCTRCKGTCKEENGNTCWVCKGTGLGEGKDWGKVLAALTRSE